MDKDFEDAWFLLKKRLVHEANPNLHMITKHQKTLNWVLDEMNRLEDLIKKG